MTGQTISHYEILDELGSGGMGVVYKARDTKLGREVAVKFLPVKAAKDENAKERFIQEAKTASSLDDPHICTIFDIDETDDGQLYIVMAYYDGTTLEDLIEKRKIKIEDCASIARQVAKGLATAHEAGIIHRDVKPGNVMVTRKGLVKILDFGVAKLGESQNLTREGGAVGTAAYMSPEQARGEELDARSDVWSIGVVLYEMLTGERPFGGGYEAAVAYSIINQDPDPIAPARPDAPEGLTAIVERALAKNTAERYPTATALADDLGEFSGETVIETTVQPVFTPESIATVTAPSVQRIAILFIVGAIVVLGIVYGAMMIFGLPDWVFPAAVFLVLSGLPIMLYSATVEKQREKLDSGEKAQLSGLKARLSMKLALQGGMIAAGTLIVAVVGYSILRAAGIGPFASLITAGNLTAQDRILVANFENRTSDPTVGMAVTEAFKIDLGQSTSIRLMDRSAVQSALTRMGVNPDTALTRELALQVASREGVKAIVEGDITSAGASFILNARVLSAVDGSQLAGFRESSQDDRGLLEAIDRLSADLREKIGESLVSIRGNKSLAQVSTSSLEALRLYTEADELNGRGNEDEAIVLLEKAVQADTLFAMAYRKLAVIYSNTRARRQLVDSISTRAYELRDRLPHLERLQTEAYYWWNPGDDVEEAERLYEEILTRYPRNNAALNNLALRYNNTGRFAEAEVLLRRLLEESELVVARTNLIYSVVSQGRIDEGLIEIDAFDEAIPNIFGPANLRARAFFLEDDFASVEAWLDSADARPTQSSEEGSVERLREHYLQARGRISESRIISQIRLQRQLDLNNQRGFTRPRDLDSLRILASRAVEEARMTGDNREVARLLDVIDARYMNADDIPDDFNVPGSLVFLSLEAGLVSRAQQYSELSDQFQEGRDEEPNNFRRYFDLYFKAMVTKEPHDIDAAIASLETLISNEWRGCLDCDREYLGELYQLKGDIDSAIAAYEEFVSAPSLGAITNDRGYMAVVQFRLGNLYEQNGDPDNAIQSYTRMIERWKDADAVLQPQVAEAQRRIDTLLDQKAREGS